MISVELGNLQDTERLGLCVSRVLEAGDVILFRGDLGAGKTTLTRYIAGSLGIDERQVTSPTFNIVHEYTSGQLPMVHVDLYRLGDSADILDTGIEDYLAGDFILLVEWAEHLSEPLGDEYLEIEMYLRDEKRKVVLRPFGSGWSQRIKDIKTCLENGEM